MNTKQQYNEFLQWLRAKQDELSGEYWLQNSREAQARYRRLLILIQAEIVTTERLLAGH